MAGSGAVRLIQWASGSSQGSAMGRSRFGIGVRGSAYAGWRVTVMESGVALSTLLASGSSQARLIAEFVFGIWQQAD